MIGCLAFVAAAALAAPPLEWRAGSAETPAPGALVLITSVSVDEAGAAWIERHRDLGLWTRADDQGRYALPISGTAARVWVATFHPRAGTSVTAFRGLAPDPVFADQPDDGAVVGRVRVRVRDAGGRPVEGALILPTRLRFEGRSSGWGPPLARSAAWTEADGGAQLDIIGIAGIRGVPSAVDLRVFADGFAPSSAVRAGLDGAEVEVRVAAGSRVVGRLVGPEGPMEGAWFDLAPPDSLGSDFPLRRRARTGSDGAFVFEHVPAESDWWLSAPAWGNDLALCAPAMALKTPADDQVLNAGDLKADAGRMVAGRLLGPDGEPLRKEAWVSFSHEQAWLGWGAWAGPEGEFRFDGVPNGGPYRLSVSTQGLLVSEENAAATRVSSNALRGMISRDHADLRVLLVEQADRMNSSQPRHKPMRGVEGAAQ
ncbi:MAG: carboxypeptidase regulatory-like domain-containing protein [Phycisphaerae bacterium]|nr:carboxypeptidase regulatory-like domain-containing protein [Phycisphaerae bacterium]